MTGRYTQTRNRFTGFAASGLTPVRMNSPIVTGTSVIESNAAAMANVLVHANGENRRPS